MKNVLVILLSLVAIRLVAQENVSPQKIQLIAGYSEHGADDLSGIVFTTEFEKSFKSKLSYTVGVGGSIHQGVYLISYRQAGEHVDASLRRVTAGTQITGHIGYNLLMSKRHRLQPRIGVLARYQSSSNSDFISTHYPPSINLPFPATSFINTEPQSIYTVGYSVQLHYNFTSRIMTIGVLGGFQNDTNGDHIPQLSVSAGKHL